LQRFLSRFLPRAHDVDDVAQEISLRAFAAETAQHAISESTEEKRHGVQASRPRGLPVRRTAHVAAQAGDPNGGGRPVWSPYLSTDRHYMAFDGTARPAVNLLPGSLELHRAIDERRARLAIPWDGGQAGLLGQAVSPVPQ